MPRAPLMFATLPALACLALFAAPALGDPASPPANGQVVAAAPAGPSAPPSDASPTASPAKVSAQDSDDEDDGPGPDNKKIHGEMGVGIGTDGYREVYGAATAPLPNGGQASVAIDYGQMGPYHR